MIIVRMMAVTMIVLNFGALAVLDTWQRDYKSALTALLFGIANGIIFFWR